MRKQRTLKIERGRPNGLLVWKLAVAAALVLSAGGLAAQTTNAPARMTYDSFRVISDRNIFNPNRYARASGRPAPTRTARPAARVESFSLVGIMAYEKGTFAFFDGTSADYKKAVTPGASMGEYQVARVTPELVQLAYGTNTFDLKVGMQMRREDEGSWYLSEGGDAPGRRVASGVRSRTRGSASGGPAAEASEGLMDGEEPEIIVLEGDLMNEMNGGENQAGGLNGNGDSARAEPAPEAEGINDPVLQRLMQRRQQLNQ